jgi:hypothetical protein
MVLYPADYSIPFIDREVVDFNKNQPKKKKVIHLPDVQYSQTLARHLRKETPLDLEVNHNIGEGELLEDFLFSAGEGWLDLGPTIRWKGDLIKELPRYVLDLSK